MTDQPATSAAIAGSRPSLTATTPVRAHTATTTARGTSTLMGVPVSNDPGVSAACHCGAPATRTEFSPNMDDYCDPCTLARCDLISAVDCPNYRPVDSAARQEYEGNWTTWEHGDFYRPKRGYVHIAVDVREGTVLVAACGKSHYISRSERASGDEPDQCAECWEAM